MDNFNNQPPQNTTKKFFTVPKIIFGLLGIILVAEIVYTVSTLTVPTTPPPSVRKTAVRQVVSRITLATPKTSVRVGEIVPVAVMIDTGSKEISGVDLLVQYDPKMLEATSEAIVKGKLLDEYPLMVVDGKNGLVSISGISSLKGGFIGNGQFASINFKAKAAGQTPLVVNFQQGSTVSSNLVESSTARNILEQVGNLDLSIQ